MSLVGASAGNPGRPGSIRAGSSSSIDLNPIEQAFSNIKRWMRQAQKRTIEDTWRHIGHSSRTSSLANAPTTSLTLVMLQSKCETL